MPAKRTAAEANIGQTNESTIIVNCVEYVKGALEGNDASHDWRHIERVRSKPLKDHMSAAVLILNGPPTGVGPDEDHCGVRVDRRYRGV
jgi:hypothetical protein